jgi:hypothetical protein
MSKWGQEKEFDADHCQKAFEATLASFVLTFHHDIKNSCSNSTDGVPHSPKRDNSTSMRRARLGLEKLCHEKKQLLFFMDGQGGSGKSAIIKEVLRHDSKFCKNIQHPLFNEMTTLVTATSRVAATFTNGEAVHRACHPNRKKPRLIVVDETSMASQNSLVSLERTVRDPRQNFDKDSPCGGFDIVSLETSVNWHLLDRMLCLMMNASGNGMTSLIVAWN